MLRSALLLGAAAVVGMLAVLLGLLLLAAGVLTSAQPDGCGAVPAGVDRDVAAIVHRTGQQLGASRRVHEAAFAAALVESGMRNLDYGDRDSLGVFQQRPSQGWGTPAQILDPAWAARQFYTRAIALEPTWTGTLGGLAQAVQRSAYPDRYDQRVADARALLATIDSPQPAVQQAGWENGRLPDTALTPVTRAPGHRLLPAAAASLDALLAAAHADGVRLMVTDTYRTYAEQVAVKAAKPHLAATPGTSTHGWGLAVDLNATTFASVQYRWLTTNGPRHGWHHPDWAQADGSKPEPWHWEHNGSACRRAS